MFEFKIHSKYKKARTGTFTTPHGDLMTPELSFVATEGEIKTIPKDILPKLPINLIIVNTFHILVKNIMNFSTGPLQNSVSHFSPPTSKFNIHDYSGFPRVIESDSGGFQVFSLGFGKIQGVGKIANIFPGVERKTSDSNNPLTITDEGVAFEFNNTKITLSPEISMDIQHKIGADIMFAFDECTSPLNTKKYTEKAMKRTHEWLIRCINSHKNHINTQALFGIVQGGPYEDLRKQSAKFLAKQDVPGFGIGGSFGKTKEEMFNMIEWNNSLLPVNKPRHLLGIGQIRDIFESVERGVDMFDCVIPTREARHKIVYTKKGKFNVKKMRNLDEVLDITCKCHMCANNVTMKQLNELFLTRDPKCIYYTTVHNIFFYSNLMKEIRQSIELKNFDKLKEKYLKYY